MNGAIYNEIDEFAARWLEELIAAGHIAPGVVRRTSIAALAHRDVAGPGQRHFFAGVGGWSLALRLAGVPDDANVWTGSCPCQPFSSAGAREGIDDDRHLWPDWFRLIRECRPPIIFGEQVASRDGLGWLDIVSADLEREGYAVGAADLAAASVGAPHIRQRLYFVAYADDDGREVLGAARLHDRGQRGDDAARRGADDDVANPDDERRRSRRSSGADGERSLEPARRGETGRLGHARLDRSQGRSERRSTTRYARGAGDNPWRDVEWIPCTDGTVRPIEPGTFPLAHGVPGRVGLLRGYGNAIVPVLAARFIRCALDAIADG